MLPYKPKSSNGGNKAWSRALIPYTLAPEKYPSTEMKHYDDSLVTIYDGFPKAKFHFLIIPRADIPDLKSLTREHIPLLNLMDQRAQILTQTIQDQEPGSKVLIGFHSIPSMTRLHLHVLSHDMDSEKLKTKAHYNSFTTPYLLPLYWVIEQLADKGTVSIDESMANQYSKQALVCHICSTPIKNMPDLKRHLKTHS